MVSRVSAIGILSQNLATITANRKQLDKLNYSLTTGQNFQELKFYGRDASRVVDLQKDIEARNSYLSSIQYAQSITSSYDTVLERLVEMTTDALAAAEPLSSNDDDFESTTTVLSNNFMLEFEANMNIKIGDRFVFGGTNFSSAPVTDLRTLSLYTTNDLVSNGATLNTIETGDQIPEHTVDQGGANTVESYHNAFAGTGTFDTASRKTLRVTINDSQPITYTMTAADTAFQNVAEGLLQLKSAAQGGLTEDEREEFLGNARNALDTARGQLRQLQASNGTVITELERTASIHESFITISQNALTELTVADDAEVAVKISALQNQLQASYSLIATQSQLTLVNFL